MRRQYSDGIEKSDQSETRQLFKLEHHNIVISFPLYRQAQSKERAGVAATPSARLQGVKIYSQKRHGCPNDDKVVYFSSLVPKKTGGERIYKFFKFFGRGWGTMGQIKYFCAV